MSKKILPALVLTGLLAFQATACSDDAPSSSEPTGADEAVALLHVSPPGGATDVAPDEPVVVEFEHAMAPHMTGYAALHEGDVNGPEVPGTWALSEDGTRMIFTPDEELDPATLYTVHLGGAMTDADGHMVDFEEHGFGMGGEWAWGEMFDHMDSEMGSGMGMGGELDHPHMGEGWQHHNGAYGMIFSFTTAE